MAIEDTKLEDQAIELVLRTAEEFAALKQVPAWLFAAMRAGERWPQGQQMTEAAFDAVVQKTNSIAIGR